MIQNSCSCANYWPMRAEWSACQHAVPARDLMVRRACTTADDGHRSNGATNDHIIHSCKLFVASGDTEISVQHQHTQDILRLARGASGEILHYIP